MSFRAIAVVLVTASLALMGGCRTAPILNVKDAPVEVTGKQATADEVKKAILRAGATLGWQMKEEEPGYIVGTLILRSHMAQVDIPYSTESYSILYKNSENLKYDGTSIHSNYNGWVQNLDRAIRAQLMTM